MRKVIFRGRRLDNGEKLEGTELTLITMITNSKELFLGHKDGLTIERKDCNGNYEPSNWCWITKAEQAKNRRPVAIKRLRDLKGRFVKGA